LFPAKKTKSLLPKEAVGDATLWEGNDLLESKHAIGGFNYV
jgi:hypothetical protein